MTTPKKLRERAAELLRLADEMEATAARALEASQQLTRIDSESISESMQRNVAVRPGPKLESKGPYAKVVRKLKLKSLRELSELLGVNRNTIRTWDQRGHVPEEMRVKLAALVESQGK